MPSGSSVLPVYAAALTWVFEDLMSVENAGSNRGRCGSLIIAALGVKATKGCFRSFVLLTFPVKGVPQSCVLTCCMLTVRVAMLLLLGVVIIVLS